MWWPSDRVRHGRRSSIPTSIWRFSATSPCRSMPPPPWPRVSGSPTFLSRSTWSCGPTSTITCETSSAGMPLACRYPRQIRLPHPGPPSSPDRLCLSARHRRILEALLHEHLPDVEVWAYGSRVNGRCRTGSDLDLVLRGPGLEKIPAEQLADFADAVRESTIPFLVEARDWARLPKQLQREIERDHIVLFGSGASNEPCTRWTQTTLGSIAVNKGRGLVDGPFGSSLPASVYTDDGVPVIRGSNLTLGISRFRTQEFAFVSWETASRHARSLCRPLDIIFTKKGTLGQTGLIPEGSRYKQYLLSSNQMKLTVDPRVADPLFVYYFVSSPASAEKIRRDSEATGVPKTNVKYLREFPIALPPLSEQRAIAHILGTLDDKIELNRRTNETLEAIARALFKSWFVDFEPVRAKVEGRDTGLPWHIAALFPERMTNSEHGEVPDGWHIRPLADLIDVNPRRRLRKGQVAPYLDMANMPTEGHVPNSVVGRPFGSGMRFANGDTLIARITPCLENGKAAYVDFLSDDETGWGSTEYIVMRPRKPLPHEFAYMLARNSTFRDSAIQNMTGTSGRQRVQASAVKEYRLAQPTEGVAVAFGDLVRPLIARGSASARESRSLADLRDTLLPKLISGDIRLLEAGKVVSGAL